jgi:hypothetical protein
MSKQHLNGWDDSLLPATIYILLITLTLQMLERTEYSKYDIQQHIAVATATILARLLTCVNGNIRTTVLHEDVDTAIRSSLDIDVPYIKLILDLYDALVDKAGLDMVNSIAHSIFMNTPTKNIITATLNTTLHQQSECINPITLFIAHLSAAYIDPKNTKEGWESIIHFYESFSYRESNKVIRIDTNEMQTAVQTRLNTLVSTPSEEPYIARYNNMFVNVLRLCFPSRDPKRATILACLEKDPQFSLTVANSYLSTFSISGGQGLRTKNEWLSTKRRVTVKGSRKTVYRSRKTGELRVRSVSVNGRGTRTVRYVKFNLSSRS